MPMFTFIRTVRDHESCPVEAPTMEAALAALIEHGAGAGKIGGVHIYDTRAEPDDSELWDTVEFGDGKARPLDLAKDILPHCEGIMAESLRKRLEDEQYQADKEIFVQPPVPDGVDSLDVTPEMALAEGLRMCARKNYNGCLILLLNNEGKSYDSDFLNAGFKMSELVALCEISKIRFISEMSPDPSPEEGDEWKG